METILLNICLILFAIYFYKKIRHGLHILQLENYYNDRYAVWLKKNINIDNNGCKNTLYQSCPDAQGAKSIFQMSYSIKLTNLQSTRSRD